MVIIVIFPINMFSMLVYDNYGELKTMKINSYTINNQYTLWWTNIAMENHHS